MEVLSFLGATPEPPAPPDLSASRRRERGLKDLRLRVGPDRGTGLTDPDVLFGDSPRALQRAKTGRGRGAVPLALGPRDPPSTPLAPAPPRLGPATRGGGVPQKAARRAPKGRRPQPPTRPLGVPPTSAGVGRVRGDVRRVGGRQWARPGGGPAPTSGSEGRDRRGAPVPEGAGERWWRDRFRRVRRGDVGGGRRARRTVGNWGGRVGRGGVEGTLGGSRGGLGRRGEGRS